MFPLVFVANIYRRLCKKIYPSGPTGHQRLGREKVFDEKKFPRESSIGGRVNKANTLERWRPGLPDFS
jgi:hypothetical protein